MDGGQKMFVIVMGLFVLLWIAESIVDAIRDVKKTRYEYGDDRRNDDRRDDG